jgi:DNA-binding NarL/FixJ family response regulator
MSEDLYYTMNPVRVCVAEDDEDDMLLFREALVDTKIPFLLSGASNGEGLVQHIVASMPSVPDYIFLDINMPLKNGYETLQELRNLLPKMTPIFMLSTANDSRSVLRALQLGANGYISKCISQAEFTNAVTAALTGHSKSVSDTGIQAGYHRGPDPD